MSLHTAIQGSFAGRIEQRREAVSRVLPRARALPRSALRAPAWPARISISSMRLLETGLALTAIATAVLIGHH